MLKIKGVGLINRVAINASFSIQIFDCTTILSEYIPLNWSKL